MSLRAADMQGADELMQRIYAAMPQKQRELIGERTGAALAAARARGRVLGGDRGHRPAAGPDAAMAGAARSNAARRAAYRLALEVEAEKAVGATSVPEIAHGLNLRGVPTPAGSGRWTHATIARLTRRVA